ncbi:growth hormone secretagogue receptor type 1-like [Gigantopelta aegis]|uniref:growth hormone secretagogue receptor type 1-like n=1 Tax=Gigantopelta aegis TaxID=1735272 RepID=UPI001B88A7D4|nr:growth hormone secretagogue receptor type 1-like [Gigantopelta aegis]
MSFVVIISSSFRTTTTSLYFSTLAVLDIIILLFSFMDYIDQIVRPMFITGAGCLLFFVFYTAIHFNVMTLVAMTTERYIVIRFPLRSRLLITKRRTAQCILAIGSFSILLNVLHIFTRKLEVYENTTCEFRNEGSRYFVTEIYVWIDSTVYSFFPILVLFVLNFLIICNVRRQQKQRGQLQVFGRPQRDVQKQLVVMSVLVSVGFMILTGPVALWLVIGRYSWKPDGQEKATFNMVERLVSNLMYTNHAVNFIFYFVGGKRFRKEVSRIFLCKFVNITKANSEPRSVVSVSTVTCDTSSVVSVPTVTADTHL